MASLAEKVLERLQTVAEETAGLLDTMFSSYPAGYRKMWHQIKHGPPRFNVDWAELYRERKYFYTVLNRLKRDGLIKGKKARGKRQSLWTITKRGLARLTSCKEKETNPFSRRRIRYAKTGRRSPVLVVFDIPERDKAKREWLRECLKRLGFSLLQKSVWMGNERLPEELLRDLRKHKLLRYVHILTISKRGTIRKIV